MGRARHSDKYLTNPKYELKQLLILLRRVNDIPLAEMAKAVGISASKLLEYERDNKICEDYIAIYIDVLEEYVALAAKDSINFRDALKIYMNQIGVNRHNNTYKMALFGRIMYDYIYANMDSVKSSGVVIELPQKNDSIEHRVWSVGRYDSAFLMLKMLREMLEIDIEEVAQRVGISKGQIKSLEDATKNYKYATEAPDLYRQYCRTVNEELRARGINTDVQKAITTIIENGYSKSTDTLKLRKLLLDELYKENI